MSHEILLLTVVFSHSAQAMPLYTPHRLGSEAHTCSKGLAWSTAPPTKNLVSIPVPLHCIGVMTVHGNNGSDIFLSGGILG